MTEKVPVVLTVAGSDSGGGAGVQADLRALNALGVWGVCAVTVVTAQNTIGVVDTHHLPASSVKSQLLAISEDFEIEWVKTGLLGSRETAEIVTNFAENNQWNLVVDPVAAAHAGGISLWGGDVDDWIQTYREVLLPRAYAVTPNIPESAGLCGIEVNDIESMERAARALHDMGPEAVIVKGGHLNAPDVFFDGQVQMLYGKRVVGGTHGGGCTFSAALTALLALGRKPLEAARGAKDFTAEAIMNSPEVGGGEGPVWAGRC